MKGVSLLASISLDLDGNVVHNVSFMSGCNGNLKVIPILIEGWLVEGVESKLTSVLCGCRPTSCADQLAKAIRAAYESEKHMSRSKLSDHNCNYDSPKPPLLKTFGRIQI